MNERIDWQKQRIDEVIAKQTNMGLHYNHQFLHWIGYSQIRGQSVDEMELSLSERFINDWL